MPIYTYLCQNEECGEEFEHILFSWDDDDEDLKCPKCGHKVKRIPSAFARNKGNWGLWRVPHECS